MDIEYWILSIGYWLFSNIVKKPTYLRKIQCVLPIFNFSLSPNERTIDII